MWLTQSLFARTSLRTGFLSVCAIQGFLVALGFAPPMAAQTKRAVLVGINVYEPEGAARLAPYPNRPRPSAHDVRVTMHNLFGPENDVAAMAEILQKYYGFQKENIHILKSQEATRDSILGYIKKYLFDEAKPGDVSLFLYAGHGSRRKNSLSTGKMNELDSTIIPADSYRGADDLRNKDLDPLFDSILAKKVLLTILYDSCHSGGVARGIPRTGIYRNAPYDTRDAHDLDYQATPPSEYPGNPAVILAAAQPNEQAGEWGEQDMDPPHGAFTNALLHTLGAFPPDASVGEIARRVAALLTSDGWQQHPDVAGPKDRALFGPATGLSGKLTLAVIGKNEDDDTFELDGGTVLNLGAGSVFVKKYGDKKIRIKLTRIDTIATSRGEVEDAKDKDSVQQGDLFELETLVVPPEARLRVWLPDAIDPAALAAAAVEAGALKTSSQIEWVDDPVLETPGYVVDWEGGAWTLVTVADGKKTPLGATLKAADVLAKLPQGKAKAKLFVYLPPPKPLADQFRADVGPNTNKSSVEISSAGGAQYYLTGRVGDAGIEYGWAQPGIVQDVKEDASTRKDAGSAFCSATSPLPLRTEWDPLGQSDEDRKELAAKLADLGVRLGRISALYQLNAPSAGSAAFPYHLAIQRTSDGKLNETGQTVNGERYKFVLVADPKQLAAQPVNPRWVYVFTVDCKGEGKLLFPKLSAGNQGNQLPQADPDTQKLRLDAQIVLPTYGSDYAFNVIPPFGVDTYFLVTTEDKIPDDDLRIFSFKPVTRGARGTPNPLADIFSGMASGSRGSGEPLPTDWSIQRISFHSVDKPGAAGQPPKP